jgi:DNA-binding transcriptional LysR family regulator
VTDASPRLRRQVWNWLPAFLEVAETGSVKEAARRLALTPAAVSRTLRLLEDTLGATLFHRVGRGLLLNATGATLRDTVRRASATVDAGLADALGDPFAGRLRVGSLGLLTEHFVVPALLALKGRHPTLAPEHLNLGTREALTALVRGELDVAFSYEELTTSGVRFEAIGEATSAIYCGRGHPLFRARRITRERVLEHPFSVPQIGDTGRVMDGWPSELPRLVGMRITLLRSNLEVCRSGALLTVLPDVTAAPHVASGEIRALPVVTLPPIPLFAAFPEEAPDRGPTRALADEVRALVTAAQARPSSHRRRTPRASR